MDELRYSGNWEIQGQEYFGNLIIVPKKGIIRLVLHDKTDIGSLFYNDEVPSRIKFIKGNLIPYGYMGLVNCRIIKFNSNISYSTKTIVLDVEYCINYNFIDYDDVKFSKMEIRLSNTFVWSSLNGLKTTYKNKTLIIEHKFKDEIKYSVDRDTTVSFVPYFHENTGLYNSEEVILKQYIKIRITSRKNRDIYFYMDLLKKIKTLIEIAIGESIDIREIIGYKRNYYSIIGDKKVFNKINIYSQNSYKDSYEEPLKHNMLFTLPNIMNNKVKLLDNWFNKYNKLMPILNFYIEILNFEKMSIERQFLNLFQALESYHARFFCEKIDEYEDYINRKYKNKPYISYLLDKEQLNNKEYILVKNRVLDLFLTCNVIFFDNGMKMIRFIRSVVNTRHYFTHYGKSKEVKAINGINLQEALCILKGLLEYYILIEIGLDCEYCRKTIAQFIGQIRSSFKELFIGENNEDLLNKINLNTELVNISKNICKEYKFGEYISDMLIDKEQEDFNYILETAMGKYYVKIFEKSKTREQCKEFIDGFNKTKKSQCNQPRIYKANGKYLFELEYYDTLYNICVFEYKDYNS